MPGSWVVSETYLLWWWWLLALHILFSQLLYLPWVSPRLRLCLLLSLVDPILLFGVGGPPPLSPWGRRACLCCSSNNTRPASKSPMVFIWLLSELYWMVIFSYFESPVSVWLIVFLFLQLINLGLSTDSICPRWTILFFRLVFSVFFLLSFLQLSVFRSYPGQASNRTVSSTMLRCNQ